MMPTMKRSQFNEMDFEEFMSWAIDNINDLTSEEVLIQFAKEKLDDDNLGLALHVLNAVYEAAPYDTIYWRYDYGMGTVETPVPVTCKEDLEDLIGFEEDDETEFDKDDFFDDYESRFAEKPWDYGKLFDDEED